MALPRSQLSLPNFLLLATFAPLLLGAILVPAHAQSVTLASSQTTVPASGLQGPTGVAVDGAGDLFIADYYNNRVVEIPAGGGPQTTVSASGLKLANGVAVDGAGDVFIVDLYNKRVVEVPAGGGPQTTVGSGLQQPWAVAVDGAGDVFIVDTGNSQVVKVPAGGGAQTTVGSGLGFPLGVAPDGVGDVFIADAGNNQVVEVPAGGGPQITVGSGLNYPVGVAVDGAGDVFIADSGNNRVVEVPAGGGAQTTLPVSGLKSPNGVAVDGAGDVFIADYSYNQVVDVQRTAVNLGNVNICPAGQTTPTPCSQTLTLNYSVNDTTTFGSIVKVLTEGAPNLDFILSGTTCAGTVTAGTSCTVNVLFAPLAPGVRMGAVQLFDDSANLLITTNVSGVGQGPAIAFGPGVQMTVGSGLSHPLGVAVDGAGDVFIADYNNGLVVEVPAGGGAQTTVGSGLSGPSGVAVDGAGDVFIADYDNGLVVEVPAGGGAQTTLGSGLSNPNGVAVDGAGDVFIADFGNNRVVKIPAGGGAQTTVGSGLNEPAGVAVDGAGDVFIADFGDNRVVKIPAGGGAQTAVGSGLNSPAGVAVDGAGDVFIADYGNNRVVEVPAGGGAQITVGSGLANPGGVAVDGMGDVFIGDSLNSRVVEVQRAQPPTFNFAATAVGNTSTDSPQSVTVQNIGNQFLSAVAPGLSIGANSFVRVPGSGSPADCTSTFSLAPGASCNLSVSFKPQSAGNLVSAATFTDNALNAIPSATQSITLQGTGIGTGPIAPTITFTGAPTSATYNTNFQVSATTNSGVTPTITATGSCTVGAVFSVGASFDAIVTITSGLGTCTVKASWAGNASYLPAAAKQTTTAQKAASGLTWTQPAAITYGTPLGATQLDATANVPGRFVYTPASGKVLTAGMQTLSVKFTPTQTADYTTSTASVQLTVNPVDTTTTITKTTPNPSNVGQAVKVNFSVAQAVTNKIKPTGSVTVNASSGESCVGTLALGKGTCSLTFTSSGSRTLTASYPGDSNNNASSSAIVTQTVN